MQTLQEIEQWSPSWEEERLEVEMEVEMEMMEEEEEEEVLCTGEQEMCWKDGRRRCVQVSSGCCSAVELGADPFLVSWRQIEQNPTSCGGCCALSRCFAPICLLS
jgi:hypothetical protein